MTATTTPRVHRWIDVLLVVFAVSLPLSVKVYSPGPNLEVILPAEALIALMGLLFALTFVVRRWRLAFDRSFLLHPVSLAVGVYVLAGGFATLFSTLPLVSLKAWTVRTSYVLIFYVLIGAGRQVARRSIPTLFLWHAGTFLLVALYAFTNQIEGGLDRASAGFVPFPFYTDHTIHAAALVFVLLTIAFEAVAAWHLEDVGNGRAVLLAFIAVLLVLALYFSFCRAAWLSAMAAGGALMVMRMEERLRRIVVAVGAVGLVVVALNTGGLLRQGSTVDSTAYRSGAWESVVSMTNTTTDPSNMERLNRWKCAVRMFEDRPWTGFGPGTYQFKYVPYQVPAEMTALSIATDTVPPELITKAMSFSPRIFVRQNPQVLQYNGGTAHSEYLLLLSESGGIAFLAFLVVVVLATVIGLRLLSSRALSGRKRWLATAATLALIAYHVHALFNNYLDDCKVAFLYWASLALLVQADRPRHQAGLPSQDISVK